MAHITSCPDCRAPNPDDYVYCAACGAHWDVPDITHIELFTESGTLYAITRCDSGASIDQL